MPSPLVFVALVIAVVTLLMVGGTWLLRMRTRRIARTRSGDTAEAFLHEFARSAHSRAAALSVYAYLQDWQRDAVEGFPVRADDSISEVYGIVDEDLDAMVKKLLVQCGRTWPSQAELTKAEPVETVRDLIRFIVAAPPSNAPSRAPQHE